jgi:hypothetical protein
MLKPHRAILGLALLIALIVDSKGQSQNQPSSDESRKTEQRPADDHRGTPDQPLTINVVPTAEQKAEAEKKDAEARIIAAYAWDQVLVGIVTFFIFVLQLVAFSLQARYMRRTVIEMRRTTHATIRAARATQKSADNTKKSVDFFIATERPWVFISDIKPAIKDCTGNRYDGTKVPREIMLKGTIKNYGRTPALMKQVAAQLRFSNDPPAGTLSTIPSQFLILEKDGDHTFSIPVGDVLNEEKARLLETGERKVWLHFSFIYRDISGESHETTGRWSHNLSLGFWDGDYEKAT